MVKRFSTPYEQTLWTDQSAEGLISSIEEMLQSYRGCLPLPNVPITEDIYFTPFKSLFPGESTPTFLGQIILENNSFIEGVENFELKNRIRGMKREYGITEDHCDNYRMFRKVFHRCRVVDIFQLDPAFFWLVADRIGAENVSINATTQIGESDYRNLLVDKEDNRLSIVFKRFHLYTFLMWMNKNTSQ